MAPGPGAVEQGVHALVCEPAAENVRGAQTSMTAFAVGAHGVVTRWPGPASEQGTQVGEKSVLVKVPAANGVQAALVPGLAPSPAVAYVPGAHG